MKNVGKTDKTIRVILGLVILYLYFVLPGNTKYLAFLGLIPLLTGLFSYCPLYSLLKINTNKQK